MLKKLKIQNLILIEKAEIVFSPHLNILTGETGAGKSAILSAIRLVSGARAETDLIRKDSEIAIIEAEIGDTLVRRELYRSGKSRCFLDEAQVSLADLKEFTAKEMELVDQSSAASLDSEEIQRSLLDTFAELNESVFLFKTSFEEEKQCQLQIEKILSQDTQKTLDLAQRDLALIEQVRWQKGEEDQLTLEHNLLTHAHELKQKTEASAEALDEITPALKKLIFDLDLTIRLDPNLKPLAESMKNAKIELEEVSHALTSYANRIEADPARLNIVEERIGAIENLKRRFGTQWELVEEHKEKMIATIDACLNRDAELAAIEKKRNSLAKVNLEQAEQLSSKRKKEAAIFSEKITQELKNLNLPHGQFCIKVQTKPLSASGLDQITFLFSANPGVEPLSIDACASGGELSRLLLAIKVQLAQKGACSCLIFDEIDSNVGGQTATILGEKLKQLAERHQVICITHFVQVAKCAQKHFGVYKQEREGTAITVIKELSDPLRKDEYTRMLGGGPLKNKCSPLIVN